MPGNFFRALQAAMVSRSETAIFTSLVSLSRLRKAASSVVSTASVKYRWGAVNLDWASFSPMILRTPL